MVTKVLKTLLFIIAIWITLGTIIFLFFAFDLGKGYYYDDYKGSVIILKSKRLKDFYFEHVLAFKYDEKYIIAQFIPQINYKCPNTYEYLNINRLKYMIVDKSTDVVFVTDKRKKFIEKKKQLHVKINFDIESTEEVEEIRKKYVDTFNNKYENINYIKKYCTEIRGYSVVEY